MNIEKEKRNLATDDGNRRKSLPESRQSTVATIVAKNSTSPLDPVHQPNQALHGRHISSPNWNFFNENPRFGSKLEARGGNEKKGRGEEEEEEAEKRSYFWRFEGGRSLLGFFFFIIIIFCDRAVWSGWATSATPFIVMPRPPWRWQWRSSGFQIPSQTARNSVISKRL